MLFPVDILCMLIAYKNNNLIKIDASDISFIIKVHLFRRKTIINNNVPVALTVLATQRSWV